MEEENLHLFITEEIYLLEQDKKVAKDEQNLDDKSIDSNSDNQVETPEELKQGIVEELSQETINQEVATTEEKLEEEKSEGTPAHIDTKQESPEIPMHDLEPSKDLPFAVFHSSTSPSDVELLHKIIDACKIPEDQYKIFGGGFDQSVHFKKALVFVPEAKAFYTPIPYKNSEFLCSKPLDQISGDVQEKAKLWTALQKFVDSL